MGAVLAQFCHLLVLRALAVSALPVVNGTLDVPLEPRCGTDFGNVSCGANLCCSASDYCGTGTDYCKAPDCKVPFSSGCDAQKIPDGPSTITIPRGQLGEVPYGWRYTCTLPNTVALTFDDGPSQYTSHILDLLAEYDAKATFFITGATHGRRIDDTTTGLPALLMRMVLTGNQIGSHTWTHDNLNDDSTEQREEQMVKNEMAFRNIIGQIPTYMRPPYTACNEECEAQLSGKLGYNLISWDLDTQDYLYYDPGENIKAQERFADGLKIANGTPMLVIAHDTLEQTSTQLVPLMLKSLKDAGYRMVTVGDCLGDDPKNWYRSA